jgi:hypothetical protein
VVACGLIATTFAHDDSSSGRGDHLSSSGGKRGPPPADGRIKPRELKIQMNGAHGVTIKADTRDKKEAGSRLRFQFTTNGFPRWRADYFNRATDDAASAFSYRIGLLRVVEFNDTANDGFDVTDADNIVYSIKLDGRATSHSWTSLTNTAIADPSSTATGREFQTVFTDVSGATVTLTLRIASDVLQLDNNVTLAPNTIKFDVDLDNLVYHAPASRYAIIFAIDAKDPANKVKPAKPNANGEPDADVSDQVVVGSSNQGHMGWVPNVAAQLINSSTFEGLPIQASSLMSIASAFPRLDQRPSEDGDDDDHHKPQGDDADGKDGKDGVDRSENREIVAFTVMSSADSRPTTIKWDPTVVIDDDAFSSSASVASVSFLALAAVLLAIL